MAALEAASSRHHPSETADLEEIDQNGAPPLNFVTEDTLTAS
jgi:hypothetical protein